MLSLTGFFEAQHLNFPSCFQEIPQLIRQNPLPITDLPVPLQLGCRPMNQTQSMNSPISHVNGRQWGLWQIRPGWQQQLCPILVLVVHYEQYQRYKLWLDQGSTQQCSQAEFYGCMVQAEQLLWAGRIMASQNCPHPNSHSL